MRYWIHSFHLILPLVICLWSTSIFDTRVLFTGRHSSYTRPAKTLLFRHDAQAACRYLNIFRQHPEQIGRHLGLDLSKIAPSRELIPDPVLIQMAERKAADMASRDYFNHINPEGLAMNYIVEKAGFELPEHWIRGRNLNSIESIAANSQDSGHFIDQLIIDEGVVGKGHRQHLLATVNFYKKATRVGIGIAYNPFSTYKYYCCVLIAASQLDHRP